MKWSDMKPGAEVYHSIFTHHGKGVVEKVVNADCLTRMFERGGPRRVIINWADGSRTTTQLYAIRKTPNRKKIRDMVACYARRGKVAKDGGDRLILPESPEL